MRALYLEQGLFKTSGIRGKDVEGSKYRDYAEWEEPVANAPSHRVLAMRRGEQEGFLTFRIMVPEPVALASLHRLFLKGSGAAAAQVTLAIQDCFTRLLSLSMETEARLQTKTKSDQTAFDVFAQNVETVKRLTHPVRDPRAGYEQTLDVLRHAKQHRPEVLTKTSLMLGLGERNSEIMKTMDDLREVDVDILTLGQYLRPTPYHLAVERYVTPDEFEAYRAEGLERGFVEVVAGPMVRSSYRAEQVLQKNNVGLAVG